MDKNKLLRGQGWTEEHLVAALRSMKRGKLSQREAAARYNIPRRTLRDHLKTGSENKRLGRKSILTPELEKDLVCRIMRYADIGLPLTPNILRFQAYKFCNTNNIQHQFNSENEMAGRKWLNLFLKRHPEISRRKAQMMNPARAQKLNKPIVNDHFTKLKSLLEYLGLKESPQKIYNMDEKGCRITLHHQQAVLAAKGSRRVHMIANEHAENVTIVGCVNAVGYAVPPMIIFKGKRMKPEYTDNLPPGTIVRMSEKGYMNCNLFNEFIDHLGKYKSSGPCLLIFDGAACHLDYSIVESAEKYDIYLYCLPSNTTHELQPLDKSVYRSFEHHWDQELLKYIDQNPERKLNKSSFNIIFTKVWPKCMTQDNICNGFRACGIYPFDADALPETAFAPAALTEVTEPETMIPLSPVPSATIIESEVVHAATTDTASDSDDNIPLSVLKDSTNSISAETRMNTVHSVASASTKSPFQQFLPTSQFKKKKTAPRKKAINYKAQQVTRDLFLDKKNSTDTKQKSRLPKKEVKNNSKDDDWYCQACEQNKMEDMCQCQLCGVWYHELCVGMDKEDMYFDCPGGCN